MKGLGEKLKSGGVLPITRLEQLGGSRTGKGSFPRINYQSDPDYKKMFDKIFRKNKKTNS